MPSRQSKDWSEKKITYPNTDSAIRWLQGRFFWLSRKYKGYQVTHGECAPHLTLEHYIQTMRAHPVDRERASKYIYHREQRYAYRTGKLRERDDWPAVRVQLMWEALCFKFSLHNTDTQYRVRLLQTHPKVQLIVDSNTSCENFWGSCVCPLATCRNTGQNVYGKMLLKIRDHVLRGEL